MTIRLGFGPAGVGHFVLDFAVPTPPEMMEVLERFAADGRPQRSARRDGLRPAGPRPAGERRGSSQTSSAKIASDTRTPRSVRATRPSRTAITPAAR